MIKNKKAQIASSIIYLVLVILGGIALMNLYVYLSSEVECSGLNPSCLNDQYCGVDFKCYNFPDLSLETEQTVTQQIYNYWPGLIIIIIAAIISFYILKRGAKNRN